MNTLFIVFIYFVAHIDNILTIEVDKCGDIPKVLNFDLEGCDSRPCPFVRGSVASANITFRIPKDVDTTYVDIQAKTFGFWVPFFPPDNNVCHSLLNSYCPLEEDEYVIYHLALPVLKAYPTISLTLKITFLDENKNKLACMQVPCKIMNP